MSEIDAMRSLEIAMESLDDGAKKRVLDWASAKYLGRSAEVNYDMESSKHSSQTPNVTKKTSGSKKSRTKSIPRLIKELNLVPKGKQSGKEFAEEKNPGNVRAKCVVCAYYLREVISVQEISVDHVYTFFKAAGWPIPSDLVNTLQQAGSAGWLDTSDQKNILITPMGENLIEHELPKPSKA